MINATQRKQITAGMTLVAKYKGEQYECSVVESEDRLMYRLTDGREFKSPSAAGSAVMGGIACNGWRFWSLAGDSDPDEGETGPATGAQPDTEERGAGKRTCENCGKAFMSDRQLEHHRANAERLCKPA